MAREWFGKITKGITLQYSTSTTGEWTEVLGVQEIPDIGGSAESIETTCFDNEAHTYISGLKNYGESLDFKLLHNADQFVALNALTGTTYYWKVSFPDGLAGAVDTTATFQGDSTIKIDGVGTNAALTDTLSIKVSSDITFA